jgi:hypothetical protein
VTARARSHEANNRDGPELSPVANAILRAWLVSRLPARAPYGALWQSLEPSPPAPPVSFPRVGGGMGRHLR